MFDPVGPEVEWEEGIWETCEDCDGYGSMEVQVNESEWEAIECIYCDGEGVVIHDC